MDEAARQASNREHAVSDESVERNPERKGRTRMPVLELRVWVATESIDILTPEVAILLA
jgi:hypothetical protein